MKTRGKVTDVDKIIGLTLKQWRTKKRRMSRNALATLVGVTGQQIAKYENGDNRIAVSTLLLLLSGLGISVYLFFRLTGLITGEQLITQEEAWGLDEEI